MSAHRPKILAFIPARSGSKRLPNKNIKSFAGKPLIAWTIEAALLANLNMDVVVSTDSSDIANIAETYGAEVPFLRPAELASDTAPTFSALAFTVTELAKLGREYEYLVFLQPTSPLRQACHITEAFAMLQSAGVKSVVSVSEIPQPTEWTMILPSSGSMAEFIKTQLPFLSNRSQDLPKRYCLNGALACATMVDVMAHESFYFEPGIYAFVMEKKFAIDIDNLTDFEYAEFLKLKELALMPEDLYCRD